MHTAGRIDLIHRTSIDIRQPHHIQTLHEMQNARKRLQNNGFDRPARLGAARHVIAL
jgi:hypothetical protein